MSNVEVVSPDTRESRFPLCFDWGFNVEMSSETVSKSSSSKVCNYASTLSLTLITKYISPFRQFYIVIMTEGINIVYRIISAANPNSFNTIKLGYSYDEICNPACCAVTGIKDINLVKYPVIFGSGELRSFRDANHDVYRDSCHR